MYIPSLNKFEDLQQIIDFMRRYSFATIVTVKDGIPVATHLPFIIKHKDEKIIVSSHFAKANPQSSGINNTPALVIFTEPHAYISPKNYEKDANVPTWNYLAVHAYGACTLLDGEDKKGALLREMIACYEHDYQQQWDSLPAEYKNRMMNGIVAFEMVVDDLQAKKKLSQNRSDIERGNIVEDLFRSKKPNEKDIADYMKGL